MSKTVSDIKYFNLLNNITDFVFEVDNLGIIHFMNASFTTTAGINTSKNKKLPLSVWLDESKTESLMEKITDVVNTRKSLYTVIQNQNKWYKLSINPLLKPGLKCNSAIIIAFDFTDEMDKQLELNRLAEELENSRDAFQDNAGELAKAYDELEFSRQELENFSKKLEEQNKLLQESEERQKVLNAQKDKFVSIISHDLRAPFTSIMGYSDALLSAWEGISDPEKLEFIGIINKAAGVQLELLDTLLQWSRLETNRVQLRPEVINVSQLVENCILSLSGIAQKKEIILKHEVPLQVSILGDHLLLSQVIQNLISNALKFTKAGGKITVLFSGETENNNLIFKVQDTGIGMPESIRTKLFRIDTKVSRKGTSGEAGTGLGLLVCKEVVELHGGSIWVESKEGQGTSFFFTLPKAFPNVLLISQDEQDRKYLMSLIDENFDDFKISFANNFDQAKLFLDAPNFSLIIYNDLANPEEDVKFLQLFKQNLKFRLIPTVLITSISSQEILENFLNSGVDFIISKPFEKNKIIDTFTKILFGMVNEV